MSDTEFEQKGESGASETYPKQCSALRKNEYVMLKGKPCKIVDMSTSKTGKHGHAKVHLVGLDIFDGKKYEDMCPSTHNMNVPNVVRKEYQLIDIDGEGFLTLLTDSGETKDDVKADEILLEKIKKAHHSEGDVLVTILSAMGKEQAISVKVTN